MINLNLTGISHRAKAPALFLSLKLDVTKNLQAGTASYTRTASFTPHYPQLQILPRFPAAHHFADRDDRRRQRSDHWLYLKHRVRGGVLVWILRFVQHLLKQSRTSCSASGSLTTAYLTGSIRALSHCDYSEICDFGASWPLRDPGGTWALLTTDLWVNGAPALVSCGHRYDCDAVLFRLDHAGRALRVIGTECISPMYWEPGTDCRLLQGVENSFVSKLEYPRGPAKAQARHPKGHTRKKGR